MAHSIELTLDIAGEANVVAIWNDLATRGLPTQARTQASTNQPHITLVAAQEITAAADDALGAIADAMLALPLTLVAPLAFGHEPATVALAVVPSRALLELHRQVRAIVEPAIRGDVFAHCDVDAWMPHVSIARRVRHAAMADIIDIAAQQVPLSVMAISLRRWDSDTKSVTVLGGRETS